jgi:uncharacterized membrane protein YebE (DUF533 family)
VANGSILGQMLEAAVRNGGGLGTNTRGASGGGLGDILGQVLGGQPQGSSGGGGQLPGGLGDILGQVLGGGQPAGRSTGGRGGDIGDILGQVLGGQSQRGGGSGQTGGGLGDILGQILGGQPSGSTPSSRGGGSGTGGLSDIMKEFDMGGQAAPRRAPERSRNERSRDVEVKRSRDPEPSSVPKTGGGNNDLLKYGGLAIFGMIAWKALQNWRAEQAGQGGAAPAPDASGFNPDRVPGGAEALSGVLVKAMIAATQSDGVVDREEQSRIVGRLEQSGMSAEDSKAVSASLATPVAMDELVKAAATPEIAAQIYTASVIAITIDKPAERAYLDRLAAALRIDQGLKANIEATLGKA